MGRGPIEHGLQELAVKHPDGDLASVSTRDVVHDVDIEVLRILPCSLDLPVFQRDGSPAGRPSECLDLYLARQAGDIIREPRR